MKKKLLIILFNFAAAVSMAQLSVVTDVLIDSSTKAEIEAPVKKPSITGSFEINYLRHYIWRGMLFGNNDVAQPSLKLSYKNFSLVLSQNFNYRPSRVPKEFYSRNAFFDEQDITISYSNEWGKLNTEFSAMAYFYFYQPTTPSTAELYNKTAYNIYKGFSLFAENSVDIASYKGAYYLNTGLLFSHEHRKNFELEFIAYAGIANKKLNQTYFYTSNGGLNLLGGSISITKNLKNYFINVFAETNFYTNRNIIIANKLNRTSNFKLAAGVNF